MERLKEHLGKNWPDEVYSSIEIVGTDISLLSKEGDIVHIADPNMVIPDKLSTCVHVSNPSREKQNDGEVDFVLKRTKTVKKVGAEKDEVCVVYLVRLGSSTQRTRDKKYLYGKLQKLKIL